MAGVCLRSSGGGCLRKKAPETPGPGWHLPFPPWFGESGWGALAPWPPLAPRCGPGRPGSRGARKAAPWSRDPRPAPRWRKWSFSRLGGPGNAQGAQGHPDSRRTARRAWCSVGRTCDVRAVPRGTCAVCSSGTQTPPRAPCFLRLSAVSSPSGSGSPVLPPPTGRWRLGTAPGAGLREVPRPFSRDQPATPHVELMNPELLWTRQLRDRIPTLDASPALPGVSRTTSRFCSPNGGV